jgi:hypothetical protein
MRRRIYYVLPDSASARKTMDDLLLLRVEERHIHFVARPDVSMEGLHEANVLQTTDILHGARQGALIGVFLGFVTGGLVVWHFGLAQNAQAATVFGLALFGALFGGWVASMAGSAVPNSQLKQFAPQLADGRILLMVDVPEHKVEEIRDKLGQRHPEAASGGIEPNIPAFP